jgi:hypothetical protein
MEIMDLIPLLSKDGLTYYDLTSKHSDAALAIIIENFSHSEPLFKMSGFTPESTASFIKMLWPACINNGLSVVAVDDATGRVAGAFTGVDEGIVFDKISMWAIIKFAMANSHTLAMDEIIMAINEPVER